MGGLEDPLSMEPATTGQHRLAVPEIPPGEPLAPLEIVPEELSRAELHKANWLRAGANALSLARGIGGALLAYRIAREEMSALGWQRTAAVGLLALTDYADGAMARRAASIDGRRNSFGEVADELDDKIMNNSLLGAAAYAAIRKDRGVTAGILSLSALVTTGRDVLVTQARMSVRNKAPEADTKAKAPGKRKAVEQFVAIAASVSPLAERPWFRAIANGMVARATYSAVRSGMGYLRQYEDILQSHNCKDEE